MAQKILPHPDANRKNGWTRILATALAASALAMALPAPGHGNARAEQHALSVLDPRAPLAQDWKPQKFDFPVTLYEPVQIKNQTWIRASGTGTASGWIREIRWNPREKPWLQWQWRVEQLHRSADIRSKERDDFAAVVYVLFGRPGLLRPQPPTLAYTWSNQNVDVGDILQSARALPKIRFIVLQNRPSPDAEPATERRNLIQDYRRAFGEEPRNDVTNVAIWTDSDQTREPVVSYYGAIQALAE